MTTTATDKRELKRRRVNNLITRHQREGHNSPETVREALDKAFPASVRDDAASNPAAMARTVLADPRDGYPLATLDLSADEIQRRVNSFDALSSVLDAADEEAVAATVNVSGDKLTLAMMQLDITKKVTSAIRAALAQPQRMLCIRCKTNRQMVSEPYCSTCWGADPQLHSPQR